MLSLSITLLYIISVIFVVSVDGLFQPTTKDGTTIRGLLGRQFFCPPGFDICEVEHCYPIGAQCCRDGSFCLEGSNCVIASNGGIICCPDGEVCERPAPEFTTSTTLLASTSTDPTTSSQASFNTASPTFYTPQSTPSAASGFQNVFVPGNSAQITWSSEWTNSSSSCDSTRACRKASTYSSFTYMANSSSSGGALYLDVSWKLTDFAIYINGQISKVLSLNVESCEFSSIGNLPTTESSINITIVVTGPATSLGRRQFDNFASFEFNGFLIGQKPPTTATSAASQGKQVGTIAATIPMALLAMIVL